MNIEHVCKYRYEGHRVWSFMNEGGSMANSTPLTSAVWRIDRVGGEGQSVIIARPTGSALDAHTPPAPQVVPDNGTVETIETLVTLIVEEMHRLAADCEGAEG